MLPLDSLKTLYYALIFPHLSYGIIAWGSADKGLIRQTELLQKRAIRTIHNAFYNSHTDPKFRKSKLLKLHDIFEYQSLLFTYDYLNNKLPSSFDGKFPTNRDVLNYKDTRQSDNLFVPNFSSKYAQKLPAYHLPKLWNKWIRLLPDSNKRYSIKNSIKSQILQTYQEYVKCNNVKCSDCYAQ